jgi:3alpha(or 20beta)-hydroxysteroid dehydrogenase
MSAPSATTSRQRFCNRTVVVTGASGGQGAVEARLLAEEGAHVVLADINVEAGRELAARLRDGGGNAQFVPLDVTDAAQWRALAAQVSAAGNGAYSLINNAGVVSRHGIMDIGDDEWRRVMDINLTGCLYGMRAIAPLIRDSGGGSIVNISSTAGLLGYAGAAYVASKWGLRGLTKTAAMEFNDWNIRVNSVHPAQVVDTAIASNALPSYRDVTARVIPMGRGARAEEIARAVLFLASDEASYITGTELAIDGGYSSYGLPRLRDSLVQQSREEGKS